MRKRLLVFTALLLAALALVLDSDVDRTERITPSPDHALLVGCGGTRVALAGDEATLQAVYRNARSAATAPAGEPDLRWVRTGQFVRASGMRMMNVQGRALLAVRVVAVDASGRITSGWIHRDLLKF